MQEFCNQTLKNGVWNQIDEKLQLDGHHTVSIPSPTYESEIASTLVQSSFDGDVTEDLDDLSQVPPENEPLCKAQ
uniref:CSON011906 protein n=1 Tax=Culicoides sonorensis TaxID=179676 RepID=A0A336KJQ7_CULSO